MRRNARGKAIDIEPYREDLRKYLETQEGLVAAWIYGSYGTPYQTPLSDLDLALLYQRGRLPDLSEEGRFYMDLTAILHEEDVSITILNRAPVFLQFQAIAGGRRLVCRDEIALADFVEFVIKRNANNQGLLELYGYDH